MAFWIPNIEISYPKGKNLPCIRGPLLAAIVSKPRKTVSNTHPVQVIDLLIERMKKTNRRSISYSVFPYNAGPWLLWRLVWPLLGRWHHCSSIMRTVMTV